MSQQSMEIETKSEIKMESKDESKMRDTLSLDDQSCEGSVKLVSKDDKEFSLERKYAFVSNLVRTSMDTDSNATEVSST